MDNDVLIVIGIYICSVIAFLIWDSRNDRELRRIYVFRSIVIIGPVLGSVMVYLLFNGLVTLIYLIVFDRLMSYLLSLGFFRRGLDEI